MNATPPTPTVKKSRSAARAGKPAAFGLGVLIPLLAVFFAFGVGTGYLVWGPKTIDTQAQSEATAVPTSAAAADTAADGTSDVVRYDVSVDDDPALGLADAPITIIEFSDFECPYCSKWTTEIWPAIQAAYPDQVRLVYRDFPLYSIHANAEAAANAANCANEQAQFWGFHDLLFSSQLSYSRQAYETFAETLGLDMGAFQTCLNEERYVSEIDADYQYATGLGIQSTPTFFVNGIALIGAQPFEVFKQVIDMELSGQLSQ